VFLTRMRKGISSNCGQVTLFVYSESDTSMFYSARCSPTAQLKISFPTFAVYAKSRKTVIQSIS